MSIEIRPIAADELFRHRELMAQSFSGGRIPSPTVEPAEPTRPGGEAPAPERGRWGLFEDGALRAAYTLLDFQVFWGASQVLAMGGIAGVGSFVEARGRGHVGALMRQMLETMRERGQTIGALYPFAWAFYRRTGWEWVGQRLQVRLPLREVRASPEGKHVRDVPAEDARAVLKPIYDAYAQNYRGLVDRETDRWDGLLQHRDNRATYVYVHEPPGGAPDSYLVWRYPSGDGPGKVSEWVANTPGAYRGLLSILHYFGTQCSRATLSLPADDPLWAHLMHWDLETRASPVWMGRVVDVPAALEALKPPADLPDGTATIAIRDEHAPWNEGTWRVAADSGQITCTRTDAAPQLAFDIQAFTQAFWGTPSLRWLVHAGRVDAADARAADWLGQLLAGPPVWTLDDF